MGSRQGINLDTHKVAVVVPVHNAADAFSKCLSSLLRYTPPAVRLILLDDASTQPEIGQLLATVESRQNTQVIRNVANEGYTRTINQGISLAPEHDVVLLNSDTEVGPGWVRQLANTALLASHIGTVTAISNNAGAFAYPDVEKDNPLPEGYSKSQVALLVRQAGGARYPELPTGNGFCMYIKRAVIDDIGLFDAEAFPRGYGEENDFCMRALRKGWRHIQDDRTWVYHVRSASIAAEVPALSQAGMAVLDERYSDYRQLVEAGMRSNRRAAASERIRELFHSANENLTPMPRPRVLVVGAEEQFLKQAATLPELEYYWLVVLDSRMSLRRVTDSGADEVDHHILLDQVNSVNHANSEYDEVLSQWLWQFAIDAVEVHDLTGHSLGLGQVACNSAIPLLVHLTDYYGACPTGDLIDDRGDFCAGQCSRDSGQDCTVARWQGPQPFLKGRFVSRWRKNLRPFYACVSAFVTSSPEISDRLLALGMLSPKQQIHHLKADPAQQIKTLLESLLYPVRSDHH